MSNKNHLNLAEQFPNDIYAIKYAGDHSRYNLETFINNLPGLFRTVSTLPEQDITFIQIPEPAGIKALETFTRTPVIPLRALDQKIISRLGFTGDASPIAESIQPEI